MMAFFHNHQLRHGDDPPNGIKRVERKLLARINHTIGIVRNIEKPPTLPTLGMSAALFEAMAMLGDEKKTRLVEKEFKN